MRHYTSIGLSTGAMIDWLLARYTNPEEGYRACLGLLSLKKHYDALRLEAACVRACAAQRMAHRAR